MKMNRVFGQVPWRGAVLLAVWALATAAVAPWSAKATFAGSNGPIAFIQTIESLNGAVGNIFTVNPDGTNLRQLTFFSASGVGAGLESWSPDGKQIAFQLFDQNTGQGQLWLMNADGSNQHVVLSDPSFNFAQPSFSPGGRQILGARCGLTSNCELYRVNVDGSGFTELTQFDSNPDQSDLLPEYSADGNAIVFTSTARGGVISSLYLMDADGSNIRPLTPPHLEAWAPDGSPDGEKFVFSTNLSPGVLDEEIWSIHADGTHATRLTDNNSNYRGYFAGPHDIAPSWSPNGDAIVFEHDAPDYSSSAIYIMKVDGSGRQLVLGAVHRRMPSAALNTSGPRKSRVDRRRRLLEPDGILPRWGAAKN